MKYKEFKKWYHDRVVDGCWECFASYACPDIIKSIDNEPFWKRAKYWKQIEKNVISKIVEPSNSLIEKVRKEKNNYYYETEINEKIKQYENAKALNTNNISDGSHTFGELYDHIVKLFSIICNQDFIWENAWKSRLHDDGTMFEGYFIVGINTPKGQAAYHCKMKYWDLFHIKELDRAPKCNVHTSNEVIERLLSLS